MPNTAKSENDEILSKIGPLSTKLNQVVAQFEQMAAFNQNKPIAVARAYNDLASGVRNYAHGFLSLASSLQALTTANIDAHGPNGKPLVGASDPMGQLATVVNDATHTLDKAFDALSKLIALG